MKKLKIILPIFLISLLFIVPHETFALTNFTTHNLIGINLYLQNNSDKTINDFREEVLENFIFPDADYQKEKYIILIGSGIPNARNLDIYYLSSDFEQNIAFDVDPALYFRNSNQGNFSLCTNYINIDTSGNITGVTQNSWSCQETTTWAGIWGSSWNYYVISTNYEYFKYDLPSWSSDSFSIDNGEEYIFQQSNIPINFTNGNKYNFTVDDYFNPTEPFNCTKSQVLGFLSNVSDFTFRIKGKSSALSEPIRGQLRFSYPTDINLTDNDLIIDIIQFNDNEVVGTYNLSCPDNVNTCYIDYSYNYIDDITSDVDFGIQVTFNTNNLPRYIQLNNCFHNDKYDDYNTSYTYTNSSDSFSNNDSVISNFLQDGSEPDLDGLVDTSLIGDGPVDSILLLPLNIMNTLLNVLNSNTCRPLVLPLPFVHQNLTLPCISTIYAQINGLNVFLNWFSAIVSAFILYEYFIRLYKWVDDTLTFRENNHFGGF